MKRKKDTEPKDIGRPPKYATVEEFQSAVDAYFEDDSITPKTITGLSLALGFESRQSFYDYEKQSEFSYAVKRARQRIENVYESRLHENNPTGAIFALKNMGWRDKQEHELSGKGGGPIEVTVNIVNKPRET